MSITDKIKEKASNVGRRAYDSVRRTVAPTDFERMARIKSETARRTRDNERQRQLNNELAKRNAARNESVRLRQQRDRLTGRAQAYQRTQEQLRRIGDNSMDLFGYPSYSGRYSQEQTGSIGILRMYDPPRQPRQPRKRRQEETGSIGILRMYDPPREPQRHPRRKKRKTTRRRRY